MRGSPLEGAILQGPRKSRRTPNGAGSGPLPRDSAPQPKNRRRTPPPADRTPGRGPAPGCPPRLYSPLKARTPPPRLRFLSRLSWCAPRFVDDADGPAGFGIIDRLPPQPAMARPPRGSLPKGGDSTGGPPRNALPHRRKLHGQVPREPGVPPEMRHFTGGVTAQMQHLPRGAARNGRVSGRFSPSDDVSAGPVSHLRTNPPPDLSHFRGNPPGYPVSGADCRVPREI